MNAPAWLVTWEMEHPAPVGRMQTNIDHNSNFGCNINKVSIYLGMYEFVLFFILQTSMNVHRIMVAVAITATTHQGATFVPVDQATFWGAICSV